MEVDIIDPPTVEKNSTGKSLAERAAAFTDRKEPVQQNTSGASGSQNNSTTEFSGKRSSAFWHDIPETPAESEKPKTPVTAAEAEKELKFTYARASASADITTAGLDNLQKLIFNILENIRYKRKFKPKDIKRIVEKELTDFTKFSDLPAGMEVEDKVLWKKWDQLHKKHLKKLGKIPFTPLETKNTREMFISIQEYNQKTLSPAWGIAINMLNIFASRGIEIYMED